MSMARLSSICSPLVLGGLVACSAPPEVVAVDGSSTVFPLTEAVAEEYRKQGPGGVAVGISGTGGGFKKFCAGEVALNAASRPIAAREVEMCERQGIDYVELPIAYDGIAVVVHPDNTWIESLTVPQLAKLWAPAAEDAVLSWSDLDPAWPDRPLQLYAPGVESGTYDYFTEAIVGREGVSRHDFNASENDDVLVRGVATDINALGFFGLAYYLENQDRLRVVPVDDLDASNGVGPVEPTATSVRDGAYQPLSRPVFLYVSTEAARTPTVASFVDFYLRAGPELVEQVGYIPLDEAAYRHVRRRFASRTEGSMFHSTASLVGLEVERILGAR